MRIEAVKTDVNQRWGVLFEKVSSDPRFFANQERERRTMSWAIAAKVAGLLPPNGKDDTQGVTRIANGLAHFGLNVKEAEDGLRSMLDFAYGLK